MADPVGLVENPEEDEVEKPDPRIKKPDLYFAAKENDTATVIALLNEQVPPTFIDKANGMTSLHWACMHGNARMAKRLLECGASEPYHRLSKLEKENKLKRLNRGPAGGASVSTSVEEGVSAVTGEDGLPAGAGAVTTDATAAGAAGDGTVVVEEDEEDEDEEDHEERAEERRFNMLKNTPLLWSTMKGHLSIVWLLLVDGYSPNDVDDLNNNMLHLAAAGGFLKILKVGIENGGNLYGRNIYHNYPLQLASSKEVSDLLHAAELECTQPLTEAQAAAKHDACVARYTVMMNNLTNAVTEATKIDSPRGAGAMLAAGGSDRPIIALIDGIEDAREWCLNEELVVHAEKLLAKLELSQELRNEVARLQDNMPIVNQTDYFQFVLPVEKLLEEAESGVVMTSMGGLERPLQQLAHDVIARCQIEYWISTMVARLTPVVCATDAEEHDMKKLKLAIQKGQAFRASEEIVASAIAFLSRLEGELILSRAIVSVPTVKLPVEAPEPGYYIEGVDVGHIKETEEYPNPPPEGGYIWEHSSSFLSLMGAIDALKNGLQMSEGTGANEQVIADAKAKLQKAEKDMKLLDAKDQADKQLAVDTATKLARKLKKKKK